MTHPPDMTGPEDMSVPGDLEPPADLSPARDLSARDLSPARDLAASPPSVTGGGGCDVAAGAPGGLALLIVFTLALALRRRAD
jgi:MYXO-CTERM domain-containing protein